MNSDKRLSEEMYSQIETRIAGWAAARPDLLAGIVVGSRARLEASADEWSDLDLVFFAEEPQVYAQEGDWLSDFGDLWAHYLDTASNCSPDGAGSPEWFAFYAGGIKVDILFASAAGSSAQHLPGMLAGFAFQDVIQRGVRVLFDKTGTAEGTPLLPALPGQEALPALPSAEVFTVAVNRFWIKAARAGKLIRRGDLWRAKKATDCELKECLLEMLAWHARAAYNPSADTWYEGRFIASWIDPRALAALPESFSAYRQDDLRRAWLATIDLFDQLAEETAEALSLSYPLASQPAIQRWLLEMLA